LSTNEVLKEIVKSRAITPIDHFSLKARVPLQYEYTTEEFLTELIINNVTKKDLQGIFFVIRDSMNGEIRIGNSKTRGFGQIELQVNDLRYDIYYGQEDISVKTFGIKEEELDSYQNILTILSFFMYTKNTYEINSDEMEEFLKNYKNDVVDGEIKGLDRFRNGVDWGYGVDPMAFVRWGYDKKKRIIYAIDEFFGVGIKNRELASFIISKNYDELIMCDSAEPKSIDELREYDISAAGAKKGPGSVEYGEKWLADLEAIVIDPKRTPNISREFEMIDYATDRDGNALPRLEDKNNHSIDATRYAFSNDMKKGKYVYEC